MKKKLGLEETVELILERDIKIISSGLNDGNIRLMKTGLDQLQIDFLMYSSYLPNDRVHWYGEQIRVLRDTYLNCLKDPWG